MNFNNIKKEAFKELRKKYSNQPEILNVLDRYEKESSQYE
jgi:hypothetical protein